MIKNAKAHKTFFKGLKIFSYITTIFTIAALIFIIAFVLIGGINKVPLKQLFGDSSDGVSILPAIYGTLALLAIALIIAVPLGIGAAVFLTEYTNKKSKIVKIIRIATETLAGIPSIVYGLFGYLIFVAAFKMGYTLLGGGLTLSIMILPVIVRSTEESLISVPQGIREGSYALGTSKVRTIFKVVLPSCASGIVTSIILAAGRVISESAVLILTIGQVIDIIPKNALSPGTSLALDIYYFYNYGYPDEAAATSVVLIILILFINALATLLGKLIARKTGEK